MFIFFQNWINSAFTESLRETTAAYKYNDKRNTDRFVFLVYDHCMSAMFSNEGMGCGLGKIPLLIYICALSHTLAAQM